MSVQDWRPPMRGDADTAARYVPGMPHPAGTGPAGASCGQCQHWHHLVDLQPTWRRAGICRRWLALARRRVFRRGNPAIDDYQSACRAFTPRRPPAEVARRGG
ncbi:MAG: hypothetical protein OHK0024_21150 [Thalassobaculales bacterium]